MRTREFEHYDGCGHNDVDNCQACALTDIRQLRPNYSAWPLAYMANNRTVPMKWRAEFRREVRQTRNVPYADNIKKHVSDMGVLFENEGKKIYDWRKI